MLLVIQDKNVYGEYDVLRRIYGKRLMQSENKSRFYFTNQLDAEIRVVNALDDLRHDKPKQWDDLMQKAACYKENLKTLNLRDWFFRRKITLGGALLRT